MSVSKIFRSVRAALGAVVFAVTSLLTLAGTASAESHSSIVNYGLGDVAVSFADDARVDWNSRDTALFEIERDIVANVFKNAATDAASRALVGGAPARVEVVIDQFDILSDIEKFFCCAKNEVSGRFTLVDAVTGEAIIGPTPMNFDHVGRGGFLAIFAAANGTDQLSYVYELVGEGVGEWIAAAD